jgi:oligopeptidase B
VTKPAPIASLRPIESSFHGDSRTDEFAWLRNREDPEVIAHLEAENAYCEDWFETQTGTLRKELYEELLARVKEDDTSAPIWHGPYRYYTRTEKGKPYGIHCRANRDGSNEVILVDLNARSEGGFISLRGFEVSPSQRFIAYGIDRDGSEIYTMEILDTESMTVLADRLTGVNGASAWIDDNRFLYTVLDDTHRPHKVFEHVLGSDQSSDREVFHEPDGRRWVGVSGSRDGKWLFISTPTSTSGEVRFASVTNPDDWQVVRARVEGVEYSVVAQDDRFLIHTNLDAAEFQVCEASPTDPSEWRTLVPGRDDVTIDDLDALKDCFITLEREKGLRKARLYFQEGAVQEVSFPDSVYDVNLGAMREFDAKIARLHYSSLNRPATAFDLDLATMELHVVKQQEIPGGFNPEDYETHRLHATAPDGVSVPISLVMKKGTKLPAPMLLYGYGSYGYPLPLSFTTTRLPLLDRGVIFAMAHIRGGGDLGEKWRNDGKLLRKKNTFTDFIACADHLVQHGWTERERLAIGGGSAGGLLIGAVLNLKPDVSKCALAWVPFVDSLNSMLDSSLPLTENEYEEWGNPNEAEFYEYMKSYAPYENVAEGVEYPDIYATSGLNDPRVGYWEPAKWVQRLRARTPGNRLTLFRTIMGAGHAGAADRYEALRETAEDWAFVLNRLGVEQ